MLQDPIADMLTRIRNVQMRKLATVSMPSSQVKENIAKVLLEEGFIASYKTTADQKVKQKQILTIDLKYSQGSPVIKEIKRISKPSLRRYSSISDLNEVKGGLGVTILSTSKGIISYRKAKQLGIGGEIICTVF